MHTRYTRRSMVAMALVVLLLAASPSSSQASHSWGNYHWARTSNPARITVINSMTPDWQDNFRAAVADWDKSTVFTFVTTTSESAQNVRKRCAAVTGKVRVCNATYGNNGWLGLAQIWASGSHITQATAKMNDTYLASANYSETNRQHVICQEIGHDWGLGHTSEDGSDQNTCMDYSNDLGNPSPNQHDYDMLASIYAHLDSTTTIATTPAGIANADLSERAQWGKLVRGSEGRGVSTYVREFGNGHAVITTVTWAP